MKKILIIGIVIMCISMILIADRNISKQIERYGLSGIGLTTWGEEVCRRR